METKTEIWKDIEGYEGKYQVSNLGRVRSLDRYQYRANPNTGKPYKTFKAGVVLKEQVGNNGYLRVKIFDADNHQKMALVHRLVAKAFIPNYQNLPEVNHKDENKSNNRADNLEWCTQSYNVTYNGLQARRYESGGGRRKRPVEQLTADGQHVATFGSMSEASEMTGVNIHHIYNCCSGRQHTAKGYRWRYADE